ncbi:MAG: hypothetical protein HC771_05075 [Synechococcales cyanobacterium CRU_2_2]|nr:hypothetical protein [Synechococcales cyanobacterium CRU_2_2]
MIPLCSLNLGNSGFAAPVHVLRRPGELAALVGVKPLGAAVGWQLIQTPGQDLAAQAQQLCDRTARETVASRQTQT